GETRLDSELEGHGAELLAEAGLGAAAAKIEHAAEHKRRMARMSAAMEAAGGVAYTDASGTRASPVGSVGAELFHMGGSYRPINSAMGQGQVFGEAGESFGDADRRAKQPLAPADAKTSYGATLARNDCHFAPESWHAWADLHNQAVEKAKAAATKKLEALALRGPAAAAANPDA